MRARRAPRREPARPRQERAPGRVCRHGAGAGERAAPARGADRRRERHRQDDDRRQAGQSCAVDRRSAAHLRGRHVSGGRGRAAGDLGDARRRRHRARARGVRSRRRGVRRHLVRQGPRPQPDPRRYGRPPPHPRQPDERAGEDPASRGTRGRRRAARSADRARCDGRSERPDAGARVHGRRPA